MRFREVRKAVEADGWYLVRINGSHHHFKHPVKWGLVTIPCHPGKDITTGTLGSIQKVSGVRLHH